MPLIDWIIIACLLIIALFVVTIMLLNWIFGRSVTRSKEDVISILSSYVSGEDLGDDTWDDFTHIPIAEPYLDAIRKRCNNITTYGFDDTKRRGRKITGPADQTDEEIRCKLKAVLSDLTSAMEKKDKVSDIGSV